MAYSVYKFKSNVPPLHTVTYHGLQWLVTSSCEVIYHNDRVCLRVRETFLGIPVSAIQCRYCQAVNRIHLIEPIWLITATF